MSAGSVRRPLVQVVDAAGAARRDARAIAAGVPSRALMQRAGAAAAAEIAWRYPGRLAGGVLVATGPGNNGGDGWVIAHALHAAGVPVRVVECGAARSADAVAERTAALGAGVMRDSGAAALGHGAEGLVVDALLGTGFAGTAPLRGDIATAVTLLRERQSRGASLVAVDLPSGLDASDGTDAGAVRAELSLTFGTIKRGHLVARELCGEIVVLDIGLGAHALEQGAAELATADWFRALLPSIAADAHKGMRGRIAIVGGAPGMAGAAILAARGALRSGAGLVKCVVSPESLQAVQEAEPAALAAPWPADDAAVHAAIAGWADAVLIGPGLGHDGARRMVERVLAAFDGPIVLDADALNAFAGDAEALRALVGRRAALLTPHPAEFARLASLDVPAVLAGRFDLPAPFAEKCGCAVLLKGTPTVIASVAGKVTVVAEGTPVLATGGSGDVLGGIAVTLLAQTTDAALAGALAAFAHGRAARAASARQVRGYTLDDVLGSLPSVWSLEPADPRPPVLVELPAVGELAR